MTEITAFPAERTAVLTGAASERGIGRATADLLASQGWNIAVLDVDGDAAAEAAQDIAGRHGVQALGLRTDVSDQDSVNESVARVEAELPPIVALVNLAGISSPTEFMQETREAWDRVFAINMTGTFMVTQRVLAGMIERKVGRVVSVSSISAQRGGGTYSKVAYSASKAAIIGFTRAVAREMGEHGITVNCIAPGPVDTDIMGGTLSDERKADMSKDILVRRVGTVRDMAALLAFLVGEDAGFITAATYDINGGLQIS
ncbi:SDR family NAD(P)-dependent oxidoreductase [Kocuria nitroreducens]|uniref:SDR family NAD(P)-dependent oxidoreductase n=1 Tax=Kocuria nitroreducens TaxID=3058914 RepID=UPI0036DD579B